MSTTLRNAVIHVETPKDTDILCGFKMAKQAANHPGNGLLREMIERCQDEYDSANTKQQKMKINRRIINHMRGEHASRFLSKRGEVWVIMEDQSIRDTVSRTLRSHIHGGESPDSSEGANSRDAAFESHLDKVYRSQQKILRDMMAEDQESPYQLTWTI